MGDSSVFLREAEATSCEELRYSSTKGAAKYASTLHVDRGERLSLNARKRGS